MKKQHQAAPKHPRESERLKALASYGILGTLPEAEFDNLVKLAAEICQMPVSLINLVAEDKQWFKAKVGADMLEAGLDVSMCAHAILEKDFFEVADTTQDERFANNPLVKGEPRIRSYTAAILETPQGLPLGTLCVLGFEPRVLAEAQKFALKTLATQVMTQLELRRALSEKAAQQIKSDDMRRFYETILANTPDFVYVFNLDKTFAYANDALLTMWGKTPEEVINKNFFEIGYEPWHAEMHEREIDEVLKTKKSIQGRVPFTGTHGRRIYDYIFNPIFNDKGDIVSIAGTTRDVTAQEEAQEAVRKSDARTAMSLEASEFIGTWEWDMQKDLVTADERFARLHALDYAEVKDGAPVEKYMKSVHPEDQPSVKKNLEQSIKEKSVYAAEYKLVQKDGTARWVASKGRVEFDAGNQPLRFCGVTIDITDRKLIEQQMKQITDAIPQQVWTARPDGQLDYVNENTRAYVGEIPVENGIVQWTGVVHPDDLSTALETWTQAVTTGEPYEVHQRLIHRASGVYRWHLSRALPIRNDNGDIIKWFGTNTDIQDQKQAVEDLTLARNAAETANVAKTEFLANMSHEIRTPMNAVIGLSNILAKSEPLTPKQREFIQTLQLSADSLLALINDLLDISKIEARNVELEEIPFSVIQLVQEVSGMMSLQAKKKGLDFTFASQSEGLHRRTFLGDPARLRQILLNLCSNAVKFTEQGGVHMDIYCENEGQEGFETISIAVRDTGIGISQKNLETIFHKFVQADSSINRKYGGTGLGLAITKTLAEIMGGAITVKSEKEKGSTFTLRMPLKVTKAEVLHTARPGNDDAVDEDVPSLRPVILLVEDYAPNVMVASAFLEQFGYLYHVAVNGREAIEKVKQTQYDAVLMDVQMHGMNGLEATTLIRDYCLKQNKKRMPIIGMTAHALSGDREKCLAAGMDDYISKPFNSKELKQKLQAVVGL